MERFSIFPLKLTNKNLRRHDILGLKLSFNDIKWSCDSRSQSPGKASTGKIREKVMGSCIEEFKRLVGGDKDASSRSVHKLRLKIEFLRKSQENSYKAIASLRVRSNPSLSRLLGSESFVFSVLTRPEVSLLGRDIKLL